MMIFNPRKFIIVPVSTSFFKTREGLVLLFVSFALLAYFLMVPQQDTQIKRARATAQKAPVTLKDVKGAFENPQASISAVPTESTSNAFCINLPVLMYHHIEPLDQATTAGHSALTVSPNTFESHITELKTKGYRVIKIEDAVNHLLAKTDPGKAVVITIDDGYKDNFSYALPIAQKHNAPITFFISVGLLENNGYMSWSDLITAKNSGLVSIYNHTWSHFSLPAGDNAEITEEITTAAKILEEKLSIKQTIFAYPYGSHDNKSIGILQTQGYQAAFTTEVSSTLCDDQMLTLPRVRIGEAPLSYFGF